MARRFFFVSLRILCLVAAYQIGALNSRASIVDTAVAGGWVVGAATEGNAFSILTADGSIHWVEPTGFRFIRTIPMPVTEVAFYLGDDEGVVTTNGDVWKIDGDEWVNLGQAPGAIRVQDSSFGSVKSRYRQ